MPSTPPGATPTHYRSMPRPPVLIGKNAKHLCSHLPPPNASSCTPSSSPTTCCYFPWPKTDATQRTVLPFLPSRRYGPTLIDGFHKRLRLRGGPALVGGSAVWAWPRGCLGSAEFVAPSLASDATCAGPRPWGWPYVTHDFRSQTKCEPCTCQD
jgi:hypothetical protein